MVIVLNLFLMVGLVMFYIILQIFFIIHDYPNRILIALLPNLFRKQAQLGVPHSRIQVELGFILQAWTCQILNFA